MFRFRELSCLVLALFLRSLPLQAEVIYDNTSFMLTGYANEDREYGDQLDLEGTGRLLTEISFSMFGDFVPDGDETMKVRLYSNETAYDDYRNAPTTLLYESENISFDPGYSSRTINNLSVRLPLDTVTFTIEFKGLKTNESAGLLLYGPPTIGSSFNEFWGKSPQGKWTPFLYSTTDFSRRANAAIRLVAQTEPLPYVQQTRSSGAIAMRSPTNRVRLAQTFTPQVSGRLDRVNFSFDAPGGPLRVSVLDTANERPGTEVLGTVLIPSPSPGILSAPFYDEAVYVTAGKQYALEFTTSPDIPEIAQDKLICSSSNLLPNGRLWARNEPLGEWTPAALSNGRNDLDAAFSAWVVPAVPPVRITTPRTGQPIHAGETVRIRTELHLPSISAVWRARFFDGDQELEQIFASPYEVSWTPTTVGEHKLRVVIEDFFRRPFRSEQRIVTVSEAPPVHDRNATIQRAPDGSVSLEFSTINQEPVRVEYSDDLANWKPAASEVAGTGERLKFTDDGPPNTEPHPKDSRQRFYRLIFGPSPLSAD